MGTGGLSPPEGAKMLLGPPVRDWPLLASCSLTAQGLSLFFLQKGEQAEGTATCTVTAQSTAVTEGPLSALWWARSACVLGSDPQMYEEKLPFQLVCTCQALLGPVPLRGEALGQDTQTESISVCLYGSVTIAS